MISPKIALAFLMASLVTANWDPATGHVRDYTVSDAWLKANPPTVTTSDIQVSECAKNTRLHYPKVQLFALFKTNHAQDTYHGCPYGECLAFTTAPNASDLVPSFTDHAVFFWHNVGGISSDGTKPISDPQTGAYGYEQSLTGKFKVGPEDTSGLQLHHDSHYPGFSENNLTRWTQEDINLFSYQKQLPMHPKCGRPCEPNKDPGSTPGAYGNYKPADASAYSSPKGSSDQCNNGASSGIGSPASSGKKTVAGAVGTNTSSDNAVSSANGADTSSNSTVTGADGTNTSVVTGGSTKPKNPSGNHCGNFCKCLKRCQGDNCSSCDSKNKNGCSKEDCTN